MTRMRQRRGREEILARLFRCLVDLIGIEPMTSSMPWNERKRKLLTAKDLLVG
jgi:hypothetical protein